VNKGYEKLPRGDEYRWNEMERKRRENNEAKLPSPKRGEVREPGIFKNII